MLWFGLGIVVAAAACGDDGGAADASNIAAMITISGTATARSGTTTSMPAGVVVSAYRNGDDTTVVAMTTTDAMGKYSLVVPTNGQPLDGYLKGTLATYMDTYLYPPAPVTADFAGASMNMITPGTLNLLASLLCGATQQDTTGVVAAVVIDAAQMPVAGATTASTPAPTKTCYNMGGTPNKNATMTDTDGVAYMFNVTGQASVSATKSGSTFMSHPVNARVGTFTTTLIQP